MPDEQSGSADAARGGGCRLQEAVDPAGDGFDVALGRAAARALEPPGVGTLDDARHLPEEKAVNHGRASRSRPDRVAYRLATSARRPKPGASVGEESRNVTVSPGSAQYMRLQQKSATGSPIVQSSQSRTAATRRSGPSTQLSKR